MSWSRISARLSRSAGLPGFLVNIPGAFGTFLGTSQQAVLVRFVADRTTEIDRIKFRVQTADTADTAIDVGIYDSAGRRLGSSGATTGKINNPGVMTVTLSSPVQLVGEGIYYVAFAPDTLATSVGINGNTFVNAANSDLVGTGIPNQFAGAVAASYPLPTTITITGSSTILAPAFFLQERGT